MYPMPPRNQIIINYDVMSEILDGEGSREREKSLMAYHKGMRALLRIHEWDRIGYRVAVSSRDAYR